ncbi:SDR family oxidoreductase [Arenibacterium sp. LLYu02]|uniref:SDR family oxidoreductase n=1 Tax=Arenibacterium sp. LLYu02 TaxID=3404132 RepID=UPI003B22495E
MELSGKTILVTGGNSGIGRAIAETIASLGGQVIITGRNPDTLQKTLDANPAMAGYPLDVTDSGAVSAFLSQLLQEHPTLDGVILNAGIMEREDLRADPIWLDVATRTIQTNLSAPIQMVAGLLPHLLTRPAAAVVTVSSGLAFVPRADSPTYSATKAAIHSWTQSLRHQLRDTSVDVFEIVPPLVATELTPGQSGNPHAMPLADFVEQVMQMLGADQTPDEILVDRALFQRNAEAEHRFDAAFAAINSH